MMPDFTATIETDVFVIDVKAHIDADGVTINSVLFGDDPLTTRQTGHFIKRYGEHELKEEILEQFIERLSLYEEDRQINAWELVKEKA